MKVCGENKLERLTEAVLQRSMTLDWIIRSWEATSRDKGSA